MTDESKVERIPKSSFQKIKQLAQQCFVEGMGTGILCFSIVRVNDLPESELNSLIAPFMVYLVIWLTGPISGGYANPSMTFAAAIANLIPACYLPVYWFSQFSGAFTGAYLAEVFRVYPTEHIKTIILTSSMVSQFFAELIASIGFLLVMLCSSDPKRSGIWASPGVTAGYATLMASLIFGSQFPVCLNPATSLASAIVLQSFDNLAVNVFTPFVASLLAALIFRYVLSSSSPTKELLKNQDFVQSSYKTEYV